MSLRDDLAVEASHARDIMGQHDVCRADYRTVDRILSFLAKNGIGAWVTRTNPTDRQRVLIDLGGDRVEVAIYDEASDEFTPAVDPETRSAIPSDSILGWMALP
jgi:hypothetical protein